MKKNTIDKAFRNNLSDLNQLSDDIAWNVYNGWHRYELKYGHRKISIRIIKFAAVIISLLIPAIIVLLLNQKSTFTTISTGNGEKTHIQLSDGSQIWVNSNTSITYPQRLNRKSSVISIEGEAYFELVGIKKKPLQIIAGTTVSYVTESSFNVRAFRDEDHIEIAILKGSLEIDQKSDNYEDKLAFNSGEKATIHRSNHLIFIESNPDNNTLAWKTGT